MSQVVEIVDCGRGPQLSNSRITVQDLVPYLRDQCSSEEIIEIMPSLSLEDIHVIRRYVEENYAAVMEQDRRIRERAAARRALPAITEILRRGGETMDALRLEWQKERREQQR